MQTLGRVVFAALAVGAVVSLCVLYATVQPDGVVLVGTAITSDGARPWSVRPGDKSFTAGRTSIVV